jgi:hypothetical protein
VAESERHLSCKQAHVGATPTRGSDFHAGRGVAAALDPVKVAGPEHVRSVSPIFSIPMPKESRRLIATQLLSGARPEGMSIFLGHEGESEPACPCFIYDLRFTIYDLPSAVG